MITTNILSFCLSTLKDYIRPPRQSATTTWQSRLPSCASLSGGRGRFGLEFRQLSALTEQPADSSLGLEERPAYITTTPKLFINTTLSFRHISIQLMLCLLDF